MEPPLGLMTTPIVEDADDSGSHIDTIASDAHDAERAHVFIAAKHVMLFKPKSPGQTTEPLQQGVTPPNLACQWMVPRHVPHDIRCDQPGQRVVITRSERLRGPPVGGGVGVFNHPVTLRHEARRTPIRDAELARSDAHWGV